VVISEQGVFGGRPDGGPETVDMQAMAPPPQEPLQEPPKVVPAAEPDVVPSAVSRSNTFTVEIVKTAEMDKVGLNVRWTQDSKALEVKGVKAGLVENHNSTCAKDVMVTAGDQIIEVNGITDDTTKMLDAVANCASLKFVFSRKQN